MTTLMQQISNNSRSVTNSNEKQQMERRLSLLNREIEMKKAAIKNIRISLQHTDVSE
jgi:flagellar biosynthesis chaperone FliJ